MRPTFNPGRPMPKNIRNIAIIAHVDHGKTTLLDAMLAQSGAFLAHRQMGRRVMDSNALERERGMTILAKNTALRYKGVWINVVDTPGHADFGGEVERILNMADGVLLLVDAVEGPMPQTRFVTAKALALGLRPIVVINKMDRANADPDACLDATFDLFAALGASDEQLDFPVLYASAKEGYARPGTDGTGRNLDALFETILAHVPPPPGDPEADLQMLATSLDWDDHLGRIAIGRIANGTCRPAQRITLLHADGSRSPAQIAKLLAFRGLDRVEIDSAGAGEIVAVAGLDATQIGDTIAAGIRTAALPVIQVSEPTLAMDLHINDSPLAGREGKFVTSRQIRERLRKEVRTNVAMRVEETASGDVFRIAGRGELHIGILLENMRREGFEMAVSRPRVIMRNEGGAMQEPYELVSADIEGRFQGVVIEKLVRRGAELRQVQNHTDGSVRLEFICPTRGLIGYGSEFMTDTRGTGAWHHVFHTYGPRIQTPAGRQNGVLISNCDGVASAFALWKLQERGRLFITAGEKLYEGMIIGVHNRENDLVVNAVRGKKLTNIRAAGKDEAIDLVTPLKMDLERGIEFISDDELLEITPQSIRLRKRLLKAHERKRAARH